MATPQLISFEGLSRHATALAVTHRLSHVHMSTLNLEQTVAFLTQNSLISAAHTFLRHFMYACCVWNDYPLFDFKIKTRFVIGSFLIAYHSLRMIDNPNEETRIFVENSQKLTLVFGRVMDALLLPNHDGVKNFKEKLVIDLSKEFYILLKDYMPMFTAWQLADKARIVQNIISSIWNLYKAQINLAGNDDERIDMQDPEISAMQRHIERLRTRLRGLSPTNLQELDDQIALEMQNRRFFVLLRQEHARNNGGVVDGPIFDFVE